MTSTKCPSCGAENPPQSRFCSACGQPFKGDPTTLIGPSPTGPATAVAPVIAEAQAEAGQEYGASGGLLVSGSILQDRYRITQLLGQGGMGAIYLATDTRFSSKTCVIKEMLDHFTDPEQRAQATESFHREADLLATFKHPGIPEVFDRFTEANRHYLVMEYINGTDLEQRLIDRGEPFGEKEVIGWAIQCCDVLSYLHHQKPPIIYRDMKPANIITMDWGKVYLVDFGIARFFNPVTRGTMIGTQGYAPPEQYRGQVEPRSDLYALGATLHYLLTMRDPQNEPPFSFPPLRTLNPEASEAMEALILKALDPEVEQRFASADEMLGQLMAIGGAQGDAVRECPHCGHLSSSTRQFCPNCKQYISKKAHVLLDDEGGLVTDAAGMHASRPSRATARLDGASRGTPTATVLAMPTGKTEVPVVPLKPLLLGLAAAIAVAGALVGAYASLAPGGGAVVSSGAHVLRPASESRPGGTQAKHQGVSAYAKGRYQEALGAFLKAVEADPSDGEARIYAQNAAVMMQKAPHYELAVAGPLSGAFQAKGGAELQGAAFAQEEVNARAATKAVLVLADDRSLPPDGALEVSKLLVDDEALKLVAIIGHLDSPSTRAALPIYGLSNLPVISPTSTSVEIRGLAANFHRLSPDDGLMGAALARHVVGTLHAQRVSVVMPDTNVYIQGLGTAFKAEAEALGAVAQQAIFPAAKPQVDWKAVAQGLKDQRPDAVFLAGSHLDAAELGKALQGAGVKAPLVGGDSLYLPELLQAGGTAVEGLLCSTYFHPGLVSPEAKQFSTTFQGKMGVEASSRAALTYEAVRLVAQAVDKAGPDPRGVGRYVRVAFEQGVPGMAGRTKVDAQGNTHRPMFVMRVHQGRFEPVAQVEL